MLKFIKTHPNDIHSCYRVMEDGVLLRHDSKEDALSYAHSILMQEQASVDMHMEQTNKLTEGF